MHHQARTGALPCCTMLARPRPRSCLHSWRHYASTQLHLNRVHSKLVDGDAPCFALFHPRESCLHATPPALPPSAPPGPAYIDACPSNARMEGVFKQVAGYGSAAHAQASRREGEHAMHTHAGAGGPLELAGHGSSSGGSGYEEVEILLDAAHPQDVTVRGRRPRSWIRGAKRAACVARARQQGGSRTCTSVPSACASLPATHALHSIRAPMAKPPPPCPSVSRPAPQVPFAVVSSPHTRPAALARASVPVFVLAACSTHATRWPRTRARR